MAARAKITQLFKKMGGFRYMGNAGSVEGTKVAGGACGWTQQEHAKTNKNIQYSVQ